MIGYSVYNAFSIMLMLFLGPLILRILENSAPDGEAKAIFELMDFFADLFPVMMIYSAAISVALASAGYGVLKRHDWGRIAVIVLLAVMIVVGLAGMIVGTTFMWRAMSVLSASTLPGFIGGIVGGLVGVLPWFGLYGYAIYKFTRPEIRAEFNT